MGMFTIIFIVSGCLLGLLVLILFLWFLCCNKKPPNINSHFEYVENPKYETNNFQGSEVEMYHFDTESRQTVPRVKPSNRQPEPERSVRKTAGQSGERRNNNL